MKRSAISTPALGVSVVLVAVSSILAVVSANSQTDTADKRAARAEGKVAANDAVNACRNRLGAAVTDANTSYSFATGQLVGAQGQLLVLLATGGDATKALGDITAAHMAQDTAQSVLNAATDARVGFEQHPTGDCRPPIPVTERPVPPPAPTPTSVPAETRRVTTTTQGHTVTTTTTTTTMFHSTPTTTPTPHTTILPQQICSLLPSQMIPCI